MTLYERFRSFLGDSTPDEPVEPPYYAPLRSGDYASGLVILQDHIRRNDAHAMTVFAQMLLMGKGVPACPEDSAAWFRQAAVHGDAGGMAGLGMVHLHGHGAKRDLAEAALWLYKATRLGHQKAANALLRLLGDHPELFGVHFSEDDFETAYAGAFGDNDEFVVRPVGTVVH
jgi:TPR repeat protein